MAAASTPAGHLTRKQIVRLAAAISADNMAAIAEGYMDIDDATIKNLQYEEQRTGSGIQPGDTSILGKQELGSNTNSSEKIKHNFTETSEISIIKASD